jgi:hypothetical protein
MIHIMLNISLFILKKRILAGNDCRKMAIWCKKYTLKKRHKTSDGR